MSVNPSSHASLLMCFRYLWDEKFNLDLFKRSIEEYNQSEIDNVREKGWKQRNLDPKRVTYGVTVDEILSPENDIVIPLLMGKPFFDFANDTTSKALDDQGCSSQEPLLVRVNPVDDFPDDYDGFHGYDQEVEEEFLVLWRLTRVLNWQMLDRRIDESVSSCFLNALVAK